MSGIGRGGRGALLLKALRTPAKPPGQSPPTTQQQSTSAVGPQNDGLTSTKVQAEEKTPAQASREEKPPVEQLEELKILEEEASKVKGANVESNKQEIKQQARDYQTGHKDSERDARYKPDAETFTQSLDKGTYGDSIDLYANTIPLKAISGGAYQYHVLFDPVIESKGARYGMLNEHKDVIGPKKAFDGAVLYVPHRLKNDVTTLKSKRQSDGSDVEITIQFVKALDPTDIQCVHIYSVVFKRIMKILDYHQVGRHYYNPKASSAIRQHRLEVWPGYITAVTPFEGGLMLHADVSHKLLRQETVLQAMYEIYESNSSRFRDTVMKEMIGSVVLTKYNNRTYRIDDIEWDKSPQNEFIFHTGEAMTYIDYYKKTYNLDIEDINQPLIIHHPKKTRRQQAGKNEIVCLIPELCTLTGLTDRMRQDFRVMKDIAAHTRVLPKDRYNSMRAFIDSIYNSEEAMTELKSWGLELAGDLFMTTGRRMPGEKIKFGDGTVTANSEADFGRDATRMHVVKAIGLNRWMLLFTKRDEAKAMDFKNTVTKVAPQMGISIGEPVIIRLQDERTETYLRAIRENKRAQVQMIVAIFPTARDDRYAAFKKLCCIEQPTPSQAINTRTISQANKLRSVTQKIVLQMNTKMGGELWRLDIPLKSVMVVGIDVYHDSANGKRSIGAFVASCNKELTRYYSRVCFQMAGQELIDGLKHCFTGALKRFRDFTGELPQKIVVYRDGVGDGQLPIVANYEVQQLSECFSLFGEDYMPKMAVIVVQKRINMRIFSALNSGPSIQLGNPGPGTILDHSVTRRDWFDFFLVSQHVRQGTVTPTHYVVVYDQSTLKPDHIQRLTYKLTHLYYNWPGTIRVPAPCQYAHKLAFLTGQALHKDPSLELSDKLFYL